MAGTFAGTFAGPFAGAVAGAVAGTVAGSFAGLVFSTPESAARVTQRAESISTAAPRAKDSHKSFLELVDSTP